MQNCVVIGNVGSIREIANSNRKAYLTIADHYVGKDANGNKVKKTNWVSVEGFIPEGLKIEVGQLVAVKFRVTSYQKKDGTYATANDIESIDVTLNSKKNANGNDAAEADEKAPADIETPAVDVPEQEQPERKGSKAKANK